MAGHRAIFRGRCPAQITALVSVSLLAAALLAVLTYRPMAHEHGPINRAIFKYVLLGYLRGVYAGAHLLRC